MSLNEKQPYKKTIFLRGLGLVLVPLLLGTAILLGLNQVWQESVRVAKEENRQYNLLRQFDLLMGTLEWRMSAAMGEMRHPDPDFESAGIFESGLKEYLAEFANKVKAEPKKLEVIKKLEEYSLAIAEATTQFPSLQPGEFNVDTSNQLAKTAMKIAVYHTAIKKLLQAEYDELTTVRKLQDDSIKHLMLIIYSSAFIAVLICCALVLSFSRSFSRRLETLAHKAGELSGQKSISIKLKGNDELSYLDSVLSRTSELLLEAAEHRRSILSMVAHDMRSPLNAACISIEMIIQSSSGLTESSKELLQNASTKMLEIIKHLTELLENEKAAEEKGQMLQAADSPQFQVLAGSGKAKNLFHGLLEFITRPRIFQKSLLLVVIPMLIQSVLVIQIQKQIVEIGEITKMERMYSDLNIINNFLRNDLVRATCLYLAYVLTSSEKARSRAEAIFAKTDELFGQEKQAAAGHNQWLAAIDAAWVLRKEQIAAFHTLSPSDTPDRIAEVLFNNGQLTNRPEESKRSLTESSIMAGGFIAEIKHAQIKLRKAKEDLDQTFLISMFIELTLAAVLLLIFSNDISARLKMLISNAACLSNKQSMSNAIKGHDEIAYLGLVLFKSQEQLDTASQQRSAIMNSVATQMRIPLSFSQDCLQKFQNSLDKESLASVARHLSRTESNISRVTTLIDDLLTMETLECGKVTLELTQFDLHDMAESAISAVASLARKKEIELENCCAKIAIKADRDRLIQVIVNFLSNALKFSASNTTVKVASEENGESIKVLVIDQGPGMDEESRLRVFEKYFQAQTPEKREGFGLGLAICSLIVHSHGGKLGVESEPGKGSIFWFSILQNQQSALMKNDSNKLDTRSLSEN